MSETVTLTPEEREDLAHVLAKGWYCDWDEGVDPGDEEACLKETRPVADAVIAWFAARQEETVARLITPDGWGGVDPADLMGRAVEAIAVGLLEATSDTLDREPSERAHREARATAERILAVRVGETQASRVKVRNTLLGALWDCTECTDMPGEIIFAECEWCTAHFDRLADLVMAAGAAHADAELVALDVDTVTETLRAHAPLRGGLACQCGWKAGLALNDTQSDRMQHGRHLATVIVTAGAARQEETVALNVAAMAQSHAYSLRSDGGMCRCGAIRPAACDDIAEAHAAHLIDLTMTANPRRTVSEVKAEALRQAAGKISDLTPHGYEIRPDGTEDPLKAAYVEGIRMAWAMTRDEVQGISSLT